jgi:hypothetical protein
MITANRALIDPAAFAQRGEERSLPKLRDRQLQSPAAVDSSRGRLPFRKPVRVAVCSHGPAPITAVSLASINV